ncbi:MAG: DUF4876 domain-containing protein, partial [Bacteroidales bacterium]
MKKRFLTLFSLLLFVGVGASFVLTSCEKEEESLLGSVKVQLVLDEGLADISFENVNVSLFNTFDNSEKKTLSNIDGVANFLELPAGVYNLSVEQPREDGEYTYTLTGNLNGITVRMGEETSVTVAVRAAVANAGLVIKEIYHPGAGDLYTSLFKDQFLEIFNNSDEVIYADGLYVGGVFTTSSSRTELPLSGYVNTEEELLLEFVYQIPSNATGTLNPIEPGKGFMIAWNAMNFKEGSSLPEKAVDNTIADYEIYTADWVEETLGRDGHIWDMNNPDVPNVTPIFIAEEYLYSMILMDTSDPAIVLFRIDGVGAENIYNLQYKSNGGADKELELFKIPTSAVIDGVEVLENSTLGDWKKLPASIDASFKCLKDDGGAFYSSMSVRRKM